MDKHFYREMKPIMMLIIHLFMFCKSKAQTDMDAIMMNKNQFCNGPMYNHASWDNYWEGKLKRDNQNLGTVSTQSIMYNVNYGITDKLNIMANAPYVWTKASAGTLHESRGVQDVSVLLKWKPVTWVTGKNELAVFLIGGVSTPLTNYQIDYLPLTVGLGSTNLISRAMVDFRHKRFTITASAAYILRSNVKIDRSAYYDTELHLTNEIKMPDAAQYQLRTGYRGKYILAETLITNWTTVGGFDITRNNSPLPSNRMNVTTIGTALKYTIKQFPHLSVLGGANYAIAGRNVGQSTAFNAGIFYAFYFKNNTIKNFKN